jgi:hypothetical protein
MSSSVQVWVQEMVVQMLAQVQDMVVQMLAQVQEMVVQMLAQVQVQEMVACRMVHHICH